MQVHTIDVVTQESGPRLTLSQLADYLAQQAQQAQQGRPGRLLNVTSLVLAGTPLEVRSGSRLLTGAVCTPAVAAAHLLHSPGQIAFKPDSLHCALS